MALVPKMRALSSVVGDEKPEPSTRSQLSLAYLRNMHGCQDAEAERDAADLSIVVHVVQCVAN